MTNYYRIMLGPGSSHADECFDGSFIGADFGIAQDLTAHLPDQWQVFNRQFRPVFLQAHPGKSKIAAGLSCGFLWTVAKGMKGGDIAICPDGTGTYRVGKIVSDYRYVPGGILPHRREVEWLDTNIDRADMSQALKNSAGSIGTVSNLSKYAEELAQLISGQSDGLTVTDPTVEDPSAFALEKHLEDFLVKNWAQTDLGKRFDIFTDDGELSGQQFQTDTGYIDILAISKDRKELLVVELKKGQASDKAVGQIQRYMGYIMAELKEDGQSVRGVIIALEDSLQLRRALAAAVNIEFYRYQVSFSLFKA